MNLTGQHVTVPDENDHVVYEVESEYTDPTGNHWLTLVQLTADGTRAKHHRTGHFLRRRNTDDEVSVVTYH